MRFEKTATLIGHSIGTAVSALLGIGMAFLIAKYSSLSFETSLIFVVLIEIKEVKLRIKEL